MTTPRPSSWMGISLALFLTGGAGIPVPAAEKPLHHTPAADCAPCHQEIYNQWQGSMHARSTALKDPIHGAMYQMMVGDPRHEGVKDKASRAYPACLLCHAPGAARDGKTNLEAVPAYNDGVSCVTCHTMTDFRGVKSPDGKFKLGTKAYAFSDEHLSGASQTGGASAGNPFAHAAKSDLFNTSKICLGCHEQLNNPHGVPICTIGALLSVEGTQPTCQSCHMPEVNGRPSHAMGGGHDPAMLKQGLMADLFAQHDGTSLTATVTLSNPLLHSFPTGAPFRTVVVRVTALDENGKEIWRNFKDDPMVEDPQGVLMMKLSDDAGKPAMPMMATQIVADTRLQPGETRSLKYAIPVEGVKTVRVEVLYALANKLLLEKIGDKLPENLKTPTLVSRVETTL